MQFEFTHWKSNDHRLDNATIWNKNTKTKSAIYPLPIDETVAMISPYSTSKTKANATMIANPVESVNNHFLLLLPVDSAASPFIPQLHRPVLSHMYPCTQKYNSARYSRATLISTFTLWRQLCANNPTGAAATTVDPRFNFFSMRLTLKL